MVPIYLIYIENTRYGRLYMFRRLFLVVVSVLLVVPIQIGYADQHKKEDVLSLIAEAQNRLTTIKSGSFSDLVRGESSRIDDTCAASQRLLSDGKIDDAYNEMNLANLYFQIIEARIDLQKAITELDDTKKNLSR
jgi:hypothetical protein